MTIKKSLKILVVLLGLTSLEVWAKTTETVRINQLIDDKASAQTQALYAHLQDLSGKHLLFGHQDTLAYGVNWEADPTTPNDSDVKRVTGDFPALYGWDMGGISHSESNLDGVDFVQIQNWIKSAYKRGGVITLSWHMVNPVTNKSAWSKDLNGLKVSTVKAVLPGGQYHQAFMQKLDAFAAFDRQLQVAETNGKKITIPVILRLFHEQTGDWFWWGKTHTSAADYAALWRFTVTYLRDKKKLHNLIYAYSPDRSRTALKHFERDYLWGYPGDKYIDILGLDDYWDMGHKANKASVTEQQQNLIHSLEKTVRIAEKKHKVPALTEGGRVAIPDKRFWTDTLLSALTATKETRKIVYALVWRNANFAKEKHHHYFAPYPGQKSAKNFIKAHLYYLKKIYHLYILQCVKYRY